MSHVFATTLSTSNKGRIKSYGSVSQTHESCMMQHTWLWRCLAAQAQFVWATAATYNVAASAFCAHTEGGGGDRRVSVGSHDRVFHQSTAYLWSTHPTQRLQHQSNTLPYCMINHAHATSAGNTYIYTYAYMHAYTHVYTYIYIYMYRYTCVYISQCGRRDQMGARLLADTRRAQAQQRDRAQEGHMSRYHHVFNMLSPPSVLGSWHAATCRHSKAGSSAQGV